MQDLSHYSQIIQSQFDNWVFIDNLDLQICEPLQYTRIIISTLLWYILLVATNDRLCYKIIGLVILLLAI
jgi:hypothetical protein